MQRILLFVVLAVLVGSCNQAAQKEGSDSQTSDVEKIISATVEELLAQPTEYEGKEVAVSGMVTHVCKHGGQKCFIVGED
ncbi:MAG: hypothetical protein KAT15_01745, partial [Bacteroidales bacterium]|nr:hypothetical protein [Bacteroidales bacterium]